MSTLLVDTPKAKTKKEFLDMSYTESQVKDYIKDVRVFACYIGTLGHVLKSSYVVNISL